jgi:hypothetical protein
MDGFIELTISHNPGFVYRNQGRLINIPLEERGKYIQGVNFEPETDEEFEKRMYNFRTSIINVNDILRIEYSLDINEKYPVVIYLKSANNWCYIKQSYSRLIKKLKAAGAVIK